LLGWWGGNEDMAHFEEWVYNAGHQPSMNSVVYCGVMSSSGSVVYKNGAVVSTSSGGRGPNGLSVGGWNDSSEFSDSQVAEVLVYRQALSPAAMAEVNAYLLGKYPSCGDGVQNGDETDRDCGGSCGACADNKRCVVSTDCTSGVCDADSLSCGPPGLRIYDFTGVEESVVVPAGKTIDLKVWGAGGQNSGYTQLGGGGGGFVSGQIIGAGQTLKLRVGESANQSQSGPFFGGGGMSGGCGPSGGGGGLSQVALSDGTVLLVAGGGGGAGPGQGALGGAGCGLNGGGTGQAIGGLGGAMLTAAGQNGDDWGGGGGGGWRGGAKGSGDGCNVGGGGGGGSCYFAPGVILGQQVAGQGVSPGGLNERHRGSAGQGGLDWYGQGTNGRIVVSWKAGLSCAVNHGGCDVNATCTDSGSGTVSCACQSGFGGDGASCVAVGAAPTAGLRLWTAADRGLVMNGSSVASWLDQSGNGLDFTQLDGNRQPTVDPTGVGGLPALAFASTAAQTMTMPTNLPAPVTVCFIGRVNGPQRQRVLAGVNNNWLLGWYNGGEDRAYFEGWLAGGVGVRTLSPIVYCSAHSGSSTSFYRNRVLLVSGSGGVQGPNGLSLAAHAGVAEFSDAEIAEVLVYDSELTGAALDQVQGYLLLKYGLE
jgi:hypothetical protein